MHKYCNTISNYFSLITNHINDVNKFSAQAESWLENDARDIFYEALSDDIFRVKLNSFPKKIINLAQKTSNYTHFYLEKLYSASDTLSILMKIEEYRENNRT